MRLPMLQVEEEINGFLTWALARSPRPSTVLEIGTGPGGLTQRFGEAGLYVVSVDLPHGSSTGQSAADCESRNRIIAEANPAFVGILGDSHDVSVRARVQAALLGRPVDILFIDGDHSVPGVTQDFHDYRPFVRPGGVIAFHDIYVAEALLGEVGVPEFWANLQGYEKHEWTIRAGWGGIGAIVV